MLVHTYPFTADGSCSEHNKFICCLNIFSFYQSNPKYAWYQLGGRENVCVYICKIHIYIFVTTFNLWIISDDSKFEHWLQTIMTNKNDNRTWVLKMKPGAFQSLPREYTTHLDWATARWPKYLIISRFMIFCIEFSLASTNSYLLVLLSTNLLLRIKLDSNEQASMDVSTGQELWPLQFINFSKPHHFAG